MPGKYYAVLSNRVGGVNRSISDTVMFNVISIQNGALKGSSPEDILAFGREVEKLKTANYALNTVVDNTKRKLAAMNKAMASIGFSNDSVYLSIFQLNIQLEDIQKQLYGSKSKKEVGQKTDPNLSERIWNAMGGTQNISFGPTKKKKKSLQLATVEFESIRLEVEEMVNDQIPILEEKITKMGAPWIEGQPIPKATD